MLALGLTAPPGSLGGSLMVCSRKQQKKPAEPCRIYKNRERSITIYGDGDSVFPALAQLWESTEYEICSYHTVTKPEIKLSCSRKAALLRSLGIKDDLRTPHYINSDKEKYRSDIFFVSGSQSTAQSCSQRRQGIVPGVSGASIYRGKKATSTHGQRWDNPNKWHEKSYCPNLSFHEE